MFGSKHNLSHSDNRNIQVGNHQIATVEIVHNLGALIDKHLSMDSFIQATIQSRLDYCNSLFYGINEQNLNILQTLQNSAA